jgi:hypothetical protein
MDNLFKDMKKVRKKDYCELQEIDRYYKDMEKERLKLYEKRKKELQKEIKKKVMFFWPKLKIWHMIMTLENLRMLKNNYHLIGIQ